MERIVEPAAGVIDRGVSSPFILASCASWASCVLSVSLSMSLLGLGCFAIPAANTPLGSLASTAGVEPEMSREPFKPLVVMLPGMGDRMEDFAEEGFIDPHGSRDFDVVAVDAHFGYYRERNLVPRLHEDILAPARAAGYEQIWLLGISMGGFGSLLYASEYPEEIAGVILLSPYLGSRKLIREIEKAGGLSTWQDDSEEFDPTELELWHWIKRQTARTGGTPVILGYGRGERMAQAYGPLLQVLEPCRVYLREGGHKWSTWRPLWARISEEVEFSIAAESPERSCDEASVSGDTELEIPGL